MAKFAVANVLFSICETALLKAGGLEWTEDGREQLALKRQVAFLSALMI